EPFLTSNQKEIIQPEVTNNTPIATTMEAPLHSPEPELNVQENPARKKIPTTSKKLAIEQKTNSEEVVADLDEQEEEKTLTWSEPAESSSDPEIDKTEEVSPISTDTKSTASFPRTNRIYTSEEVN